MVENPIRLRTLSPEELTGIINIYPWFGAARMELCRRLAETGRASEEQFAEMALHVAAREKVCRLLRGGIEPAPVKPAPAVRTAAPAKAAPERVSPAPSPRVAGGDYFSRDEYKQVRQSGDDLLSGLRFKAKKEPSDDKVSKDIADRFQTEALAEILAEQGYPELAKRIYSKLILVNPEKSAYFADLIDKLN